MKIDEAIKILELENKHPWSRDNSPLRNAVKLGIEALEVIQKYRRKYTHIPFDFLSSETED